MTSLTLVTLAVMVAAAISRKGYWWALAIGGGTPIGAALLFGDTAVPTFYMAAIGAGIGLAIRLLSRTRQQARDPRPLFPGAVPLLIFTGWSIVVTLIAPALFVGKEVFLGPDPDSIGHLSGSMTNSNIGQVAYLLLGIVVVFFLAYSPTMTPGVVGVAATIVTLLSFWRYLNQTVGIPFPEGLFDNNSTYRFIETLPGGAPRFRGILSEPSGLALSSLVTISYSLSRAAVLSGWRLIGVLVVAGMATLMAAISTSATFVVVAVILVVLAGLRYLNHVLVRLGGIRRLVVVAAAAAVVASLWVLPWIVDIVQQVVNEKVGSSSYSDRTLSDNRSYGITLETFGFGVGLGSNRSSSFVAALLATVGVVGFVLFVVAVWSIVRGGLTDPRFRPVVWALTAVLVAKIVSSPDLSDSSGILWLSLGVLAWAGVQHRYRADRDGLILRPAVPASAL